MKLSRLLIPLACLGAWACHEDVLTTSSPMLSAVDALNLPPARDGVWVANGGCSVPASAALPDWKDCATGFIVRRGRPVHPDDAVEEDPARLTWVRMAVSPDFQIAQDSGGDYYSYDGFDVVRLDERGRMVALRVWRLKCGPPPPEGSRTEGGKPRHQTLEPYPGVTVEEGGCAARGREGLIAAARASRDDPKSNRAGGDGYHWLREETPADWPEAVPVAQSATEAPAAPSASPREK